MATGVLVLGVEKATRLLGHLALSRKVYEATIRLGQATVTDDAEGEVTVERPRRAPERRDDSRRGAPADRRDHAGAVVGLGDQDKRSALVRTCPFRRRGEAGRAAGDRVSLRRARDPARRRQRATTVIDVAVTVECSSGTYIRALARDLGVALGVGGHLTALRRTSVGPYDLAQAHTLEQLGQTTESGEALPVLPLAAAAAAAFPRYDVDVEQAKSIAHGGFLASPGLGDGPIGVFGPDGAFLALVEERGGRAKPIAVFV